jgi:hypothetical protein
MLCVGQSGVRVPAETAPLLSNGSSEPPNLLLGSLWGEESGKYVWPLTEVALASRLRLYLTDLTDEKSIVSLLLSSGIKCRR